MEEKIINKVSESGIITLDLATYIPETIDVFDLKEFLFMGQILREKEFRDALKREDWEKRRNKNVAVFCSVDAIVPVWAYMLVFSYLQPIAKEIVFGNERETYQSIFIKNIASINIDEFVDKRVVIKGCGEKKIEEYAYTEAIKILHPIVKSIMYGEPCSTVPIYKRAT